jgi:hypothetical protein
MLDDASPKVLAKPLFIAARLTDSQPVAEADFPAVHFYRFALTL